MKKKITTGVTSLVKTMETGVKTMGENLNNMIVKRRNAQEEKQKPEKKKENEIQEKINDFNTEIMKTFNPYITDEEASIRDELKLSQ